MAEFNPVAMDEAAEQAEDELSFMLTSPELEPGVDAMVNWMTKWHSTAGYKRLGRILIGIGKEKEG